MPLYRCANCSTWFADPKPWDYTDWREEGIDGVAYYLQFEKANLARMSRVFETLAAQYGISGKMLDVGCGVGHSLVAAERLGWEAAGIEPNRTLAQHARESLGIDVIQCLLRAGFLR